MSVETMAVVLHHSRATGTAKLILLGIANHAGDGGAWPCLNTLARYANVEIRQVRKTLRQLEKSGELATDQRAGGLANMDDEHRPNLYHVLVKCPPDCGGGPQHRTRPHDPPGPGTRPGSRSYPQNPQASYPQGDPPVPEDRGVGSPRTGGPRSQRTGEPSVEPARDKVVSHLTVGGRADAAPDPGYPQVLCYTCSLPRSEHDRLWSTGTGAHPFLTREQEWERLRAEQRGAG